MAVSSLKANQIRQEIDHIAAQNGEATKPSLKPEGEEVTISRRCSAYSVPKTEGVTQQFLDTSGGTYFVDTGPTIGP